MNSLSIFILCSLSLVLNSKSPFYQRLQEVAQKEYEDLLWSQDAVFLERNSRTFGDRVVRINENTERICEYLRSHPKGECVLPSTKTPNNPVFLMLPHLPPVKTIHYPKFENQEGFDAVKKPGGGYGGLFSVILKDPTKAPLFYDNLNICKARPSSLPLPFFDFSQPSTSW